MNAPPVLWSPAADARATTRLGKFLTFCESRSGRTFDDYDALWAWSVGEGLEACWAAVWDFFDVDPVEPYREVLDRRTDAGRALVHRCAAELRAPHPPLGRHTIGSDGDRGALADRVTGSN